MRSEIAYALLVMPFKVLFNKRMSKRWERRCMEVIEHMVMAKPKHIHKYPLPYAYCLQPKWVYYQ
jgi:hypothetical protein